MALPFLSIAAGLQQSFVGSKLAKVQAGTKTVTTPKTDFGKWFGKLTGRTQASELQKEIKAQNSNLSNMIPIKNSSSPITGSVNFGGPQQADQLPKMALVGAVIIAVIYFVTNKKPSKRRR